MKLVARSGIGTIAAGVAKAKADVILISGHVGGTGASPADLDQVRRHPVGDGPVRSPPGADAQPPAPPGACCAPTAASRPAATSSSPPCWAPRSSASARASLIAMGCIMVRQCHSNTCPVGVCTQDADAARQVHRHAGEGRQPVQLHRRGSARDPGRSSASARCTRSIGRTDLLKQVSRGARISTTSTSTRCWRRPTPGASTRAIARSRAATRCPTRSTRR